jgi:DNA-binding CsgD family transcriptional regulator
MNLAAIIAFSIQLAIVSLRYNQSIPGMVFGGITVWYLAGMLISFIVSPLIYHVERSSERWSMTVRRVHGGKVLRYLPIVTASAYMLGNIFTMFPFSQNFPFIDYTTACVAGVLDVPAMAYCLLSFQSFFRLPARGRFNTGLAVSGFIFALVMSLVRILSAACASQGFSYETEPLRIGTSIAGILVGALWILVMHPSSTVVFNKIPENVPSIHEDPDSAKTKIWPFIAFAVASIIFLLVSNIGQVSFPYTRMAEGDANSWDSILYVVLPPLLFLCLGRSDILITFIYPAISVCIALLSSFKGFLNLLPLINFAHYFIVLTVNIVILSLLFIIYNPALPKRAFFATIIFYDIFLSVSVPVTERLGQLISASNLSFVFVVIMTVLYIVLLRAYSISTVRVITVEKTVERVVEKPVPVEIQAPDPIERRLALYKQHNLTRRETDIAELIVQGLTREAITQRLNISTATVDTHISHIYAKFNVQNVREFFTLLV